MWYFNKTEIVFQFWHHSCPPCEHLRGWSSCWTWNGKRCPEHVHISLRCFNIPGKHHGIYKQIRKQKKLSANSNGVPGVGRGQNAKSFQEQRCLCKASPPCCLQSQSQLLAKVLAVTGSEGKEKGHFIQTLLFLKKIEFTHLLDMSLTKRLYSVNHYLFGQLITR